jgi:hypothetical protein
MNEFKSGYLVGNGAAQNVSLGWIPDLVIITNATDGDIITIGHIGPYQVVPFSSGGTTEIEVGDKITGATSGATAWVREVLEYSGTWAGGDAAGFFVVEMISGTFQSENVDVGSDGNLATVTANVTHSVNSDTEVASATGNAAITRYAGSTTVGSEAAPGFTVGSTVAEEAKLLRYAAFRGGH